MCEEDEREGGKTGGEEWGRRQAEEGKERKEGEKWERGEREGRKKKRVKLMGVWSPAEEYAA